MGVDAHKASSSVALFSDRRGLITTWVQPARASGTHNGVAIKAGDGPAVSDEGSLVLTAHEPIEALLFELA